MRPLRLLATAFAVVLSAAVVAPIAPASAATGVHYVDCSRHAAGLGTKTSPWSRLALVDAQVFGPGEQILLRRGTTCHGQLAPAGDGSAGHPITIGAYGTGARPTVAGGGTGNWTGAVQLWNQAYWTIRDLHVTNTSGGRSSRFYRSGVMVLNTSNRTLPGILVEGLTVDSVTSSMSSEYAGPRSFGGISVITQGGLKGRFVGLVVRDNVVTRVGRTGIVVSNNSYPAAQDVRVRITGNRVSWTRGDGIVLTGATRSRLDHNVSAHVANEWPCAECGPITRFTANAAIWTGSSNHVRIDHNEAYGTKALGGDGEGFDIDSTTRDTLVEYNYAHDNEGGGIFFCGSVNAVARFNILQNNLKSAFAFIGTAPANNTSILNNTVYISKKSKAAIVRTFGGHIGGSIRFSNNLIYSHGNGDYGWPRAPKTSGNTLRGRHDSGRPTDRTTSRIAPQLVAPGTGGIGFGSLGGYRVKPKAGPGRPGAAIPSGTNVDFFGKPFNPKHPPRGAAG